MGGQWVIGGWAPGTGIRAEIIRTASQELVDAFGRLLPQLSSTAGPLDHEALDRMVTCDANTVLVARTPDSVVGTLTPVLLPLPSGLRARVTHRRTRSA
ncbi:hypothetical protein [Streptomyces sp. NPDC057496]|uniref:hypothetical protein n=1 Tax=Streptomyces sp. NPDC057496 TaxID=3346149 RepID=UPI00367AB137